MARARRPFLITHGACPYTGMLMTTSSYGRISGNPRPGSELVSFRSLPCIDKASELHEGGGISFFLIEQLHINPPLTAGAKSKLVIR